MWKWRYKTNYLKILEKDRRKTKLKISINKLESEIQEIEEIIINKENL